MDDGPPLRGVLLAWAVLLAANEALFGEFLLLPGHPLVLRAWIAITDGVSVSDTGRDAFQLVSMLLRGSLAVGAGVLVARAFPLGRVRDWRFARLIAYPFSLYLLVLMMVFATSPGGGCLSTAEEAFGMTVVHLFTLIVAPLLVGRALLLWSMPRLRRGGTLASSSAGAG